MAGLLELSTEGLGSLIHRTELSDTVNKNAHVESIAYCTSDRCIREVHGLGVNGSLKRYWIQKDVGPRVHFCPDCDHALLKINKNVDKKAGA